jgi:hypothetical protein
MKKLFWILLLGNAILFAVMQYGGLGWGAQELQAQPALRADMIRQMPAPQSTPAKTVQSTPAKTIPVPVPAQAAVSSVPAPASTLPAANPDTLVCFEWGDFSGADLTRATAALSTLQLANKLGQRKIERDTGYWVYFAPFKNKAAVKQKIAELKVLGINEYFVVQTPGKLLNAISLGVFKTREAAQNFLDQMRAKGVRTAKVGEQASKLKVTLFMLNGVDAATEAKLTAMQKDFAGTELNKVSCTH